MKKPSVAIPGRARNVPLRVLIACADTAYAATLEDFMAYDGYEIERCHNASGVLRAVGRRHFDILLLDTDIMREEDLDVLSFVRHKDPRLRVILLFDIQQMEQALEGLRKGAFFYLPKTSPASDVALAVAKAVRQQSTESALDAYEQNVFEELVGRSPGMQRVIALIRKVAPTDSTVLLLGESGTGKEVLANTLHRLSRRHDMPFIAINCAALPDALLESEMFGHVKGAFTGADRDKRGLFEEAEGGTIFLDEVGDMAPITQAKLLRVLQNGEIRRVGASTSSHVDVRVLAATNRDLIEAVAKNAFREDLYYRLNVIQIRIPPLRERLDALPALLSHFIAQHNARFEKHVQGLDDRAADLLLHYPFPGNVRELESIVAHAVIVAEGDRIRPEDLPDHVCHGVPARLALPYNREGSIESLEVAEARQIREALEKLEGNQTLAAKKLGISRSTLWRKMREYAIER